MKVWTDDYGIRASWSKSPWRQFHRRFILLISLGALVIAFFLRYLVREVGEFGPRYIV